MVEKRDAKECIVEDLGTHCKPFLKTRAEIVLGDCWQLARAMYMRVAPVSLRIHFTQHIAHTCTMSTSAGRVKKTQAKAKVPKVPKAKPKPKTKTSYDVERDENGKGYFYFRSEPVTRMVRGVDVKFSYEDLVKEPESTAHWVRPQPATGHLPYTQDAAHI